MLSALRRLPLGVLRGFSTGRCSGSRIYCSPALPRPVENPRNDWPQEHTEAALASPGLRVSSGAGGESSRRRGFTLMEVLLAIATLAMAAAAVSAVFMSGIQTLDAHADEGQRLSQLRSTMEELVSTPLGSLGLAGSKTVTIRGTSRTLAWTAIPADMDGNFFPESDARLVTVTLDGQSLTMILVDHEGKVKKL